MTKKFTSSSPADDISVLTAWLDTQDKDRYLYRGQRRDYGTLVPSSFRKFDLGTVGNCKKISDDGYFKGSDADELMHLLMNSEINRRGADLGSYIAQQYFCFSQSLDFSSSIAVASFFATYIAPEFLHPLEDNESLGIIYTLDKAMFSKRVNMNWRSGIIVDDPSETERDLFVIREHPSARIDNWRPEQYYFSDNWLRNNSAGIVDTHFLNSGRILTVEEFISAALPYFPDSEADKKAEFQNFLNDGGYPPIRYLRALSQRGAIVTPPMLWKCKVPLNLKKEHGQDINSVWGEFCIGVQDLSEHPAIEKHYFRHKGLPIPEISRELLWPDKYYDDSLYTIINWVNKNIHLYPNVKLEEVIDFGYKGGAY